jgi:hypothetical protein
MRGEPIMSEWLRTFASDDLGKTIIGAVIALTAVAFGALLGTFKDMFVGFRAELIRFFHREVSHL